MTVVALFQRRRRRTQHPAANDVEAKLDSSRPVPTTFRERWRAIKPFGSLQMLLHPDVFLLLWATSCTCVRLRLSLAASLADADTVSLPVRFADTSLFTA